MTYGCKAGGPTMTMTKGGVHRGRLQYTRRRNTVYIPYIKIFMRRLSLRGRGMYYTYIYIYILAVVAEAVNDGSR